MNLEDLNEKTILFLGKSRAFSEDEFYAQLRFHKIYLTREQNDAFDFVLEGRMMTPYEQNLSDELYELGKYEFITIDTFEKLLADKIDTTTLLMSLKLSNDKVRLKSFLQNAMIPDGLFFKLLKMYSWGGEDFFENDDNRDISAALVSRFYENIERNHNVQYATTGIYHLILQTEDAKLLEAIAELEPVKFHPKIIKALSIDANTPKTVLKKFLKKGDKVAQEAMAYNPNLDITIIKELLKHKDLAEILAKNVKLDEGLFELLFEYKTILAENESLTKEMQTQLLELHDDALNVALSHNRALDKEINLALVDLNNEELNAAIYANRATPQEILKKAYEDEKNHLSLAKNPSTPSKFLEELFHSKDEKVLDALARNESTPVAILYQLQLDSRFERAVKTNAAFGKHIQSENIGWL
ncbi:hypothetical protein [Sulfurimonas sp.]